MNSASNFLIETICQGKHLRPDVKITLTNDNIAEQLKNNDITFSYEIISDEPCFSKRALTIRLYLPGIITTGRYVYSESEANDIALNKALKQALLATPNISVLENTTEYQKTEETVSVPVNTQDSQPLTEEEILNSINQGNQVEIKQTDFGTITITEEELPMTSTPVQDNNNDLFAGLGQMEQVPFEPTPVTPVQEQPKSFTQEQIQKMNMFKQRWNITDDTVFAKFVNSWNQKYTSKMDITPSNIDDFLKWTDTLGEYQG